MSTHEIIFIIMGALVIFASLFFFYLPENSRLQELRSEIGMITQQIEALRQSLPAGPPEEKRLPELTAQIEQIMARLPRRLNVSEVTKEIIARSQRIEGIKISSIAQMVKSEAVENGEERWMVKIVLCCSFLDFTRFLHSLGQATVPLSVEEFTIKNDDQSALSQVELIIAASAYHPGEER